MYIDARLPNGYLIVCDRAEEEHVFIVRNLGPSVECPKCGGTALSGDLATAFVGRRTYKQGSQEVAPTSVMQTGRSSPGDQSRHF